MKTTDSLPNTTMAPPLTDAKKITTKGKDDKDKEAKYLKAKKEKEEIEAAKWKESREKVSSALTQGEEYFLKQYPEFGKSLLLPLSLSGNADSSPEGITLQSMPYDAAMWKIYKEDGSN